MQLTIFNGSPRFKNSNSKILTDCFIKGFNSVDKEEITIHYLSTISKTDENCQTFLNAENVIIIFPLYTDSMP